MKTVYKVFLLKISMNYEIENISKQIHLGKLHNVGKDTKVKSVVTKIDSHHNLFHH